MEININNKPTAKVSLPVEPEAAAVSAPVQNEEPNKESKTSDHLYLEKLKFNPELRKSWLNFFIVNFRVVILLIILLTGLGVYSFSVLPRESTPEVKIPYAIVMTTYPGASPADIEELVSKKIETGIAGVKNIKEITSQSSNSISLITVEFDAKANLNDSIRSLRDAVSNTKTKLPTDANEPMVKEISFDDSPIMVMSLSGPYDGFTLREAGDKIKDELEKIPDVREVAISGGDEREFVVEYDPQKLALYNLSAVYANQKIQGANLAIPAGTFEGENYSYPVRADGRFFTAAVLAAIPIIHTDTGAIIYLKDIATVKDTAIKKTVYSRLSTGGQIASDNVTLQIIKKTGGNVIETAKQVRSTFDSELKKLPSGLRYDITVDYSEDINDSFSQLSHDFLLTIILVFTVLFLIVGFKEALVAGLAVPLVFFATFGAMLWAGISLNFLSLFSLILALGLLVDDAIVVVSATKQYLRTGKFTPEEAVLLVLNDFKVVLTTTTLTTVWAFLPLLMSTGIMGEFIKSIPITVSVTLITSLIIALIINHPLAAILERIRITRKVFSFFWGIVLILAVVLALSAGTVGIIIALILLGLEVVLGRWYFKKGKEKLIASSELVKREWASDELIKKKLREQGRHDNENFGNRLMHGIIRFDIFLPIYEKYLRRLTATKKARFKTLTFVAILFLLAISLPIFGVVKNEFFPASDSTQITINLEGPIGLNLAETDKLARRVEERLYKYPEIENFTTIVGTGGSSDSLVAGGNSSHLASFTLKLTPTKERQVKAYELADMINADVADIKEAVIKAEAPSGGPPSGAAFQANIAGDDLQILDKIAKDLEGPLKSLAAVSKTEISLKDSPADYTFMLSPERLELYDLSAAYVGSALRLAITGTEVTTVIEGGKEIKVLAKFAPEKIPDLAAIQNLQILNTKNQPVFLKDVATIKLEPSVATITRIDQRRTVLLTATLKGGANATLVVSEFQKKIKDYELPSGYEITYGGESEQNTESVMSILQAMVVAFLLIISTLIIQFNSFKKAAIVLVTIPLALIGVFFGLALSQLTLSFPGLIGILALCGIVVKNAIILMDKINLNLKSGIAFNDAIVDAGKSRLEAIFITSICTILGIIPITFSNEMWQSLGGAIIFGLLLSSFLTLFIVPTLFMSFIKDERRH
ncbi:MAG: efflux RND transporter permease subunit [Patescibacteria group bacterium]|jgi:HAE1 family hydrophobic/amphiphilic exporter-1